VRFAKPVRAAHTVPAPEDPSGVHELLQQFSDLFINLPEHLEAFARDHQRLVYLLLGAIVFCETGLVIMPFLPGDSLLFACGALAQRGGLSAFTIAMVFIVAALMGDNLNYWLGRWLGPRVLRGERIPLLNRKSLDRTRAFFARHGGKSIVLARFVPIIRTFAPFTAGVGQMPYPRFLAFSVFGAALWVGVCVTAGWFLGNIEIVKNNFSVVVICIVVVSVIPVVIGWIRAVQEGRAEKRAGTASQPK
jgi:membrane-associated protein